MTAVGTGRQERGAEWCRFETRPVVWSFRRGVHTVVYSYSKCIKTIRTITHESDITESYITLRDIILLGRIFFVLLHFIPPKTNTCVEVNAVPTLCDIRAWPSGYMPTWPLPLDGQSSKMISWGGIQSGMVRGTLPAGCIAYLHSSSNTEESSSVLPGTTSSDTLPPRYAGSWSRSMNLGDRGGSTGRGEQKRGWGIDDGTHTLSLAGQYTHTRTHTHTHTQHVLPKGV